VASTGRARVVLSYSGAAWTYSTFLRAPNPYEACGVQAKASTRIPDARTI